MVGQNQVLPEGLLPLLSPLHKYVEEGIVEAHEFFATRKWPIDPWMFCHQVRLYVRHQLDDLSECGITCESVELAFSGIELAYGCWRLKLLMAEPDGSLPGPGRSYAKQVYYNYNLFSEDDEEEEPSHLVVLWHVDEHYNFVKITVCNPSTEEVLGDVPHPINLRQPPQQLPKTPEQDLPQLDLPEDLDMEEKGSDS